MSPADPISVAALAADTLLERGTVVHAGPSAELAADRNLLEGLLGVGIAEEA